MVKTHKSSSLLKKQMELGAEGFLCGTIDECEMAVAAGAGVQAVLPYEMELLREVKGVLPETVEAVPVGAASTKRRLKVQDLETEEFPEEEPADFQEGPVETEKIQLIENPLPLPKKHVPKVLDYKLDNDDDSDFDYPVADDDDFDH